LLTFFYRQYRELLEAGHIYVAQPPLYKIKKKKKEKYILSDREFVGAMIKLGIEGSTLSVIDSETILEGESLEKLLDILVDMEELIKSLERRGLRFSDIMQRAEHTEIPVMYVLDSRDRKSKKRFFFTDQDFNQYRESVVTKKGGAVTTWKEGDNPEHREQADLELHQIRGSKRLASYLKTICSLGLDPAYYDNGDEPRILVKEESGKEYRKPKLRSLIDLFRNMGQAGVDIQRFKGLGEMNPEQLWDTTMNPEKRSLLKVRLEDAIKAEEIFTILMGSQVEPRKEFIEAHASEVRNLDV